MTNSAQRKGWTLNLSFRPAIAALATAIAFGLTVGATQSAQAQTFTVLHAFTDGADGSTPYGVGLTMDAAGNLYGGASYGGQTGQCSYQGSCGVIYRLSRKGSGWIFNTLYEFTGTDGEQPDAPLVFGPDGALYSTTYYGGSYSCIDGGCGVVYSLRPPPTSCKSADCPWTETVLHQFVPTVMECGWPSAPWSLTSPAICMARRCRRSRPSLRGNRFRTDPFRRPVVAERLAQLYRTGDGGIRGAALCSTPPAICMAPPPVAVTTEGARSSR